MARACCPKRAYLSSQSCNLVFPKDLGVIIHNVREFGAICHICMLINSLEVHRMVALVHQLQQSESIPQFVHTTNDLPVLKVHRGALVTTSALLSITLLQMNNSTLRMPRCPLEDNFVKHPFLPRSIFVLLKLLCYN